MKECIKLSKKQVLFFAFTFSRTAQAYHRIGNVGNRKNDEYFSSCDTRYAPFMEYYETILEPAIIKTIEICDKSKESNRKKRSYFYDAVISMYYTVLCSINPFLHVTLIEYCKETMDSFKSHIDSIRQGNTQLDMSEFYDFQKRLFFCSSNLTNKIHNKHILCLMHSHVFFWRGNINEMLSIERTVERIL